MTTPLPTVDVHIDSGWLSRALRRDVRYGLGTEPRSLPPRWFYDDVGSELFDKITRLTEYYPTEAEREILRDRAAEIVVLSGADTLVELGSGTSDKTRLLLEAFTASGQLRRFVPFDVNETTLRAAIRDIALTYPSLGVHGVVGDFEHHLGELPSEGRQLTAFLGGTIGNFEPGLRAVFLRAVAARMKSGDSFLLGTDLVKDIDRLELAYDDPAGVTAAFNKNVLAVINRELRADFDLDKFEHVATFDVANEWMDLRLRSTEQQTVGINDLDLDVHFRAGEEMRTEISAKFRPEGIGAELRTAGLEPTALWKDAGSDYAVTMSAKP